MTAFDDEVRRFRWALPERLNIGSDIADRRAAAGPDRPAIVTLDGRGAPVATSFGQLAAEVNRFANVLTGLGLLPGDRVAILLPQSLEAAVAHLAVYKAGLVALPLSVLFGQDALAYRLKRSGARLAVSEVAAAERLAALRQAAGLRLKLVTVDGAGPDGLPWAGLLAAASDRFSGPATGPADPALMIFTSGTTGLPKPALHGHGVLEGHMPGIQMAQDGLGRPGDLMWTPADWAWAGGLLNALLPALKAGVPVLAHRPERFDPEAALRLMADLRVTNAFLPPTALKLMREVTGIRRRHALSLRAVGSAGEALGREAYDWAAAELGLAVNEFYGQTECNAVIGSAHQLGVGRAGAIGKAYPGHEVLVVDREGRALPPGETGEIAVRRPDPVMFLEYAGDSAATAGKFVGDLMLTGDRAVMDEEGYVRFVGRDDDVITSSGYRIGPGEIEECLLSHPAVRLAVAVGKPDPVRTEIVKAYVVLREGHAPTAALADDIRRHVRERLSAHEYPRELDFVDDIPMTTSGKLIRRHFRDLAAGRSGSGSGPG